MKNRSMKWLRFFESLIYTILIALPLISVFARTIYAQSNPNAKDSYTTGTVTTYNLLNNSNNRTYTGVVGETIRVTFNSYGTTGFSSTASDYLFTQLSPNIEELLSNYGFHYTAPYNVSRFEIYPTQIVFYINGTVFNIFSNFRWGTTIKEFSGVAGGGTFSANPLKDTSIAYFYNSSVVTSALDNIFEQSMNDVVNTYGSGNINFINWFGTLFFPNVNTLYFRFINMYLNYSVLVSSLYLIYYFLTFFIKIIRNLVDSFIKKGESW